MNKKMSILAILVFFMPLFMLGCAKNVGQGRVDDIAYTIEDASYFITSQGLSILEDENPEAVPLIRADLEEIVAIAGLYEDGSLSVADVATTISSVLIRINARFDFLGEREAELIGGAINFLSKQISRYINEKVLPTEAGQYIASLAKGINDAIADYRIPIAKADSLTIWHMKRGITAALNE